MPITSHWLFDSHFGVAYERERRRFQAANQPRDLRGRFVRRLQPEAEAPAPSTPWFDEAIEAPARPTRTVEAAVGRLSTSRPHYESDFIRIRAEPTHVPPETKITLVVVNRNFETFNRRMPRGVVYPWLNEHHRDSSNFRRAIVEETDESYRPCQRCGEITQIDSDLCRTCAQSYARCAWCRGYHGRDRMDTDEHGQQVCEVCSETLFICEECGYWRRLEDESEEENVCRECHHGGGQYIHAYHSSRHIRFLPDGSSKLYFGIELETDNYDDIRQASRDLHTLSKSGRLFWQEHDGSLQRGIEIITQPCTLEYHLNSFPWQEITEIVDENGGRSEDTETAAMHVHFSLAFYDGDQRKCQLRLIYLFERFRSQLLALGRTSDYLADRSAQAYNQTRTHRRWFTEGQLHRRNAEDIMDSLYENYGRYQAINIVSSQPTNEIRLFRGTLKPDVIKASIELVDFLVRLAEKTSLTKLETLRWSDLAGMIGSSEYQYLPTYLVQQTNLHPSALETE